MKLPCNAKPNVGFALRGSFFVSIEMSYKHTEFSTKNSIHKVRIAVHNNDRAADKRTRLEDIDKRTAMRLCRTVCCMWTFTLCERIPL